jgi:hypothetical protein
MTTLTIELPDGFAEDLARYTRQHANNPAGVGASVEDLARYLLSLAETAYRRPGSWEAAALESAGIFDFDPPPLDGDEGDYDMRLTWGEATAVRLLDPLACTFSVRVSAWARGLKLNFWTQTERPSLWKAPKWREKADEGYGDWFKADMPDLMLSKRQRLYGVPKSHPQTNTRVSRALSLHSEKLTTRQRAHASFRSRSQWAKNGRIK